MGPEMSQPITQTDLPSQQMEPARLAHLAPEQRNELLTLIDTFFRCGFKNVGLEPPKSQKK